MKLPTAPGAYDKSNESQTRKALESADAANFKKGQDLRLVLGERIILKQTSGGTLWNVYVDSDGRINTVTTT